MTHPGVAEPRTKEDWRAYLDATEPPRPTLPAHADYLAMPEAARRRFNDARRAHHSALVIVRTPIIRRLHDEIACKVETNEYAPAGARRGIVIDGPPTVGKSTLVKLFAADFELGLREAYPERFTGLSVDGCLADYVPVIYVSVPSQATPRDLSIAIADWMHQPFRPGANKTEITNLALRATKMCGIQLIIIDDVHFLDLSSKEGNVVNDHLKYLANHCAATFVYTGHDLESSGLFLEGHGTERATQTSGRNALHKIEAFKVSTPQQIREWAAVIKTMEDALVLFRHPRDSLAKRLWSYLHERTGGSIASLSALIREAAIRAVRNGDEAITKPLLDAIVIDRRATRDYETTRKRKPRTPAKPAAPDRQAPGMTADEARPFSRVGPTRGGC